MGMVKRLINFVLIGALLGAIVASLVAPGYLVWYNTPGTGTAQCNCTEVARSTAESLISAQVVGALIGATVMLILGIFISLRRQRALPGQGGATGTESPTGSLPPSPVTPSSPPRTPPVA